MAETKFREKIIALNGRLRTNVKGVTIGDDFKQLINLRYGDLYPRGVLGQSRINTSALDNPKIRSIHHLRKEQPAESHVVVQALDSNGANPKIYYNSTAIPSAGNFVGGATETVLYTEDTSAGVGRFAEGPDGALVYCNGEETCLWGGDEFRVASFIRYDPDDNTKRWDYTEQVSNTDTDEVATLEKSGGSLDANTVTLLHFNDNLTDTSASHTWTDGGTMTYTTAKYSNGGVFDGSSDYIYCTDASLTDFDFSGGTFTIDFWVKPTLLARTDMTIYYQENSADTEYVRIWLEWLTVENMYAVNFQIFTTAGGGTPIVEMTGTPIPEGAWSHIAVVEDGDDWYLFIVGSLADSTTTSDRMFSGSTDDVYIGYDDNAGFNEYFDGMLDEFRIINGTAAWTSGFTIPSEEYPVNSAEVYVGSILPIQGINFTVENGNDTAAAPIIYYWDGDQWSSVGSVTDTTDVGGDTLKQDGKMSWTYVEGNDKAKIIDMMYLYWYRLAIPDLDDGTTISYVTVDMPFQPFKDIWDGEQRSILSFLQWDNDNQTYYDHTVAVFEDYYDSADSGTYAAITNSGSSIDLDTSDDYLLVGSTERLAGLSFNLVGGKENVTNATMSVSYWDGDSWVSVGTIADGTLESDATLAKSGFVTWDPPAYGTEFKRQDLTIRRTPPESKSTTYTKDVEGGRNRTITRTTYYDYSGRSISGKRWRRLVESVKKTPFANAQYDYPLYWYKIDINTTIAGDVQVYHVSAIPAPAEIGAYNFPVYHNNRIFLIGEQEQHKNQVVGLSPGTLNVANGSGAVELRVGTEELTNAGGSLILKVGEKILPTLIIFKKNQTWAIYGSEELSDPICLDEHIGCTAPGSIKNAVITAGSSVVEVILFQSHRGIYACDGSSVFEVSNDISNYFDQSESTKISTSRISNSEAFYDETMNEYHWLWTSTGSTHDKEFVLDCEKLKWFEMQRGSGSVLQCGSSVRSTDGDAYIYGGTDDGFLMRLENGNTFATASSTNNIQFTMQPGDFPLMGDEILAGIGSETILRNVCLHSVGKTSTSNTVAVTHYGDASSTPSSQTATFDAGDSDEEIQIINWQPNIGPHVYHSLKFVITNSDDTIGFEPVFLALMYEYARQRTRGT